MAAPHGTLPGVASTRETTLRPDYVMEPCTWPLSAAQEEEEEASFFGGRSAAAKAPVELAPATQVGTLRGLIINLNWEFKSRGAR